MKITKHIRNKYIAIAATLLGIHAGFTALGSISGGRRLANVSSRSDYLPELKMQAEKNLEELKANEIRSEKEMAQLRIFSKFKPIDRQDFDIELSGKGRKSFFENFFNKDLTNEMEARYEGNIAPIEEKINSPYRRANNFEMNQYNQSRTDMANWTAKEVLNNKLKELFRGADKDSGAMQVIGVVRTATGGVEEEKNATAQQTKSEQKTANRKETQAQKIARVHKEEAPKPVVEESIPTRLKTRFNVLKKFGNFNFINPIVSTNVDLNLASEDKVNLQMNKDFKKLQLRSNANFGVQRKVLRLNLNKSITDTVSLDLDSTHYTGDKKDPSGKKSMESAKVTYSLSF